MPNLVASPFFIIPGKCSIESPYDSVNPPCIHVHVPNRKRYFFVTRSTMPFMTPVLELHALFPPWVDTPLPLRFRFGKQPYFDKSAAIVFAY